MQVSSLVEVPVKSWKAEQCAKSCRSDSVSSALDFKTGRTVGVAGGVTLLVTFGLQRAKISQDQVNLNFCFIS